MKRVFCGVLVVGLLGASLMGFGGDPVEAEKVLHDAGYTMIDTDGFDLLTGCMTDEKATPFTAVSPVGRDVEGWVCRNVHNESVVRVR